MADKEATVFLVDVARSMGKCQKGREKSDLEWSLDYVWDKISTIVGTGRKTLMAGVIGMGTDKTNNKMAKDDASYDHISVLQPIAQILLGDLQQLPKLLKPSNTDNRDILSGIIVGTALITEHCKHLKYKKKLIVVTNGIGAMDDDDIDSTADELKKHDIELLLLGIDFDDADYGFKEEDKPPVKARNEQALKRLVDRCGGRFATMQEGIEGLAIPEVKPTRPVPTYRGYLRLGDPLYYDTAVTIDVERYFKVSIRRPPTATSFAIKQQADAEDSLTNVSQKFYYAVKDPTRGDGERHVEREELAKGYQYGRTAVHISELDENITKLESFSSYDIMGFIPAERLERYMIIDNTNMLVAPRNNDKAALALSSLIRALYELNSLAVARLVKKDGAEPAITLLSPVVENGFECLIENILPFAEDIRSYRFPPLDKVLTVSGQALTSHHRLPSDDLVSAMSDFVDSMSLIQDNTDLRPIDDTYSPVLHTIEGAIKHRAVHPGNPLPPKSELFAEYARQPQNLQEAAKPALEHLVKVANVKKIPPKQKGRKRYRDQEKPISGLDVDALFEPGNKKKISADNAIPDFKRAMDDAKDDDAQTLAKEMFDLIEKQISKSYGSLNYPRAIEMLRTVREELFLNEFASIYNELITGLKNKIIGDKLGGDRLQIIGSMNKERLGLITKSDWMIKDGPDGPVPGGVDEKEAEGFWRTK